jgi:cyanobactin maturation PatA/PatG family protease
LARAISLAATEGADIINISGGEFSPSGSAHPILADAISTWAERGVLIVAAAGNQGCECLHVPGALPAVLAVGAMNAQGEPLEFSNWGGSYQDNGVLAPGGNIRGAEPGGRVAERSGTSYATPIVSGVAALLLHLARKLGISITPQGIRNLILKSALGCEYQPLPDCRRVLAGRLNVEGATELLLNREVVAMTEPSSLPTATPNNSCEPAPAVVPVPTSESSGAMGAPSIEPASLNPQAGKNLMTPALPTSDSTNTNPGSQVTPADCGCGGKAQPPQLVFALGQLSFDYGTRQRRDFFFSDMTKVLGTYFNGSIDDPKMLLAYLARDQKDQFLPSIIWTLKLNESAIYAIKPTDAYAKEIHAELRSFLLSELPDGTRIEGYQSTGEGVELVSVPGVLGGQVRLFTGEKVPVIIPDIRGMYSWTLAALKQLITTTLEAKKEKRHPEKGEPPPSPPTPPAMTGSGVDDFFEKVYYQLRNLGLTPQERALNFAATDALQIATVFQDVLVDPRFRGFELDSVQVLRSPICRPDSDCWDVELSFFNPSNSLASSRVFRVTVDVSDVMPVQIGDIRSWSVR